MKRVTKLTEKKRIKSIEPFNIIYFKDCFFTLLFSVIKHYEKNINHIIANESIFYDIDEDNSIIKVIYEPIRDYKKVLMDIGIYVTIKKRQNDIVEEIISSISENKPVIVLVDCFYEPMIMDAYKKKHLLHSALVYGYDNQTQSFNIIEFEYSDSTNYKKNIISYKDMSMAHNSKIIDEYSKKSDNIVFEFSLYDNRNEYRDAYDVLIDNIKSNKTRIFEGMNYYHSFLYEFESNTEKIKAYPKKCLDLFVNIYNSKKIEYYRLSKIFNKFDTLVSKQYDIMQKWSNILTQYGIYYYNTNLNEQNIKKIKENLRLAYNMEQEFTNHIFKLV